IETDKATMDFESFYDGVLLYIGIQEGQTAPVDTLLAIIGKKGEDISGLITGNKSAEKEQKVQKQENSKQEGDKENSPPSEGLGEDILAGIEIIRMPRLSDTMEEGTVAKWNFKIGNTVKSGDILAEIETDKATMDFESFYDGTLLYIGINEGETAPVDSVLAAIGAKGTDVSKIDLSSKPKAAAKQEAQPVTEKENTPPLEGLGEDKKPATSTQAVTANDNRRIFASPLAKKIAKEKGVDLRLVQGSGESGRIIKKDIENYQPVSGTSYIP